ncbi:MAG: hypothetical protein FGM24_02590 [Candidatus Kapabacteria bacterium]|nr:hypothetical protein [Candidatus Kapabacteria bacterium]
MNPRPLPIILVFLLQCLIGGNVMRCGHADDAWMLGVRGMAVAGITSGPIELPFTLGTAPNADIMTISLPGGTIVGASAVAVCTYRPAMSLHALTAGIGLGLQRLTARTTTPVTADTSVRNAVFDLTQDRPVVTILAEGRRAFGTAGWHIMLGFRADLPIGDDATILWQRELNAAVLPYHLEQAAVRHRSRLPAAWRLSGNLGVGRDIMVGMHGNTGMYCTPFVAVGAGKGPDGIGGWMPISVQIGVTLSKRIL